MQQIAPAFTASSFKYSIGDIILDVRQWTECYKDLAESAKAAAHAVECFYRCVRLGKHRCKSYNGIANSKHKPRQVRMRHGK